jgi:UDP-N-acetylmuramoylalanine--D-glutamate ligase
MTIQSLSGKSVCILGFGQEGRATFNAILHFAPDAEVTVADANSSVQRNPSLTLITGPNYLSQLETFDVIIKSPGIKWEPPKKLARKVTTATQIFFDSLPASTTTIGITGTKGKSTTAYLIHHILKAAGKSVHLAGNIGRPMLSELQSTQPGDIFVLELSSYQLDGLTKSPHIAVITSFFPDHLDYHGSLHDYREAKANITRSQTPDDIVYYNAESGDCEYIASFSHGQKIPFSDSDYQSAAPKDLPTTASNLAAAVKVTSRLGVPEPKVIEAINNAKGLPHRQEKLGRTGSIEWIDDSASVTPESTLAALSNLASSVDTIILGGLDRGYDFTELGEKLASSNVRNIILFPDTGLRIKDAVEHFKPHPAKHYYETSSMDQAIKYAASSTLPGKVCLLSSASPSYNLFDSFADRGENFRQSITKYAR